MREAAEVGCHRSEVLGLELRAEGRLLRLRDPFRGRDLLTHAETSRALQEAERERDEAEPNRLCGLQPVPSRQDRKDEMRRKHLPG